MYAVKIISPAGKSGFEIREMRSDTAFMNVDEFKEALLNHCENYITSEQEVKFGYITPGHGKKGKQVLITGLKELEDMYKAYTSRKEIVLWIRNEQRKRPNPLMRKMFQHPKLLDLGIMDT